MPCIIKILQRNRTLLRNLSPLIYLSREKMIDFKVSAHMIVKAAMSKFLSVSQEVGGPGKS